MHGLCPRKQLRDGVAGTNTESQAVKAAMNAGKSHAWPLEIDEPSDNARAIYEKIQTQRSHDDRPAGDLIELARISRLIDMADSETTKYLSEGALIYGGKTGLVKIENPRGRAVNTLNSTINSTLRRLGITAISVSQKTSQAARGSQERRARDAFAEPEGTTTHHSRRNLI